MRFFLFFSLLLTTGYNLIDLLLWLGWKIRLQPSFFIHPASFWSSVRKRDLLGLLFLWSIAGALLYPLPVSVQAALFSLSLLNFRQKKIKGAFPLVTATPKGKKIFEIQAKDQPHIIFLVLESFRSKSLGPLSPHFNQLKEKGIYFSEFHATGNLTNRCMIASLFGVPPAHTPSHLGAYCDISLIGLPQIFKAHGYHNAWIQSGSIAFDRGVEFLQKQGFQTILGKRDIAKEGTSWGVFDEYLMPFAVDFLAKQTQPTFLNLYTITNHHPWTAPPGWNLKSRDPFLNTFAYTDWCLGLFIEEMKKQQLLEKSILFIYGDHGQDLADRDPQFEIKRHLYQENVHVPLLIYAEGRISSPQTIDTLSSQIDLLPTVLDLMSFKDPHNSLGKSLLRQSSEPIFFSQPFGKQVKGCRKGKWKYLQLSDKEELYDLETDPEETVNLIGKYPTLKEDTTAFFNSLEKYYSNQPSQQNGTDLHLNFSNAMLTDEKLEEIAKANPNLASINLSHCLLLTDRGIQALLTHCPKLEKLYVEGIDEITGIGWSPAPYLIQFKAFQCPNFQAAWIEHLPSLLILQLGSAKITDEDLFRLSQKQKNLIHLHLADLPEITEKGLNPFIQANSELQECFIDKCPNIR